MIKTKFKIISIFLGAAISLSGVSTLALAVETENTSANTTTTISSLQELVNSLKAQIEILIVQIAQLQEQMGVVKQTQKDILQLVRQLRRGMRGEDVEDLQEILASDPGIYPEGLVTGYFGPLTEKAVSRFQKKMGVEQVGQVGPKTLSKLNELLTEGNASGKVPPGLLIAPGIRKKISFTPEPLEGQKLPLGIARKLGSENGTTTPPGDDSTPPVISGIAATSTTATTSKIVWDTDEEATSKVWYDTSTPVLTEATTTPMMSDSSLVLNHDVGLSGLTASTTYYYVVSSTDEAGNIANSTDQSFTTQ